MCRATLPAGCIPLHGALLGATVPAAPLRLPDPGTSILADGGARRDLPTLLQQSTNSPGKAPHKQGNRSASG